jgi:uncharacterized membrane protein
MSTPNKQITDAPKAALIPLLAALVALIGLGDSIYLTVEHFKNELPPCNIVEGCERVLTSSWSEVFGMPLSLYGAAAYFVAFSLALLTGFGSRSLWNLFGAQVILMSIFTCFLLYLQGFVIGAFCQFCLLSALTTFTMLILFLVSKFLKK